MKVFVNPGHAPGGYPDPGAVGPSGLRESDVRTDSVGNSPAICDIINVASLSALACPLLVHISIPLAAADVNELQCILTIKSAPQLLAWSQIACKLSD